MVGAHAVGRHEGAADGRVLGKDVTRQVVLDLLDVVLKLRFLRRRLALALRRRLSQLVLGDSDRLLRASHARGGLEVGLDLVDLHGALGVELVRSLFRLVPVRLGRDQLRAPLPQLLLLHLDALRVVQVLAMELLHARDGETAVAVANASRQVLELGEQVVQVVLARLSLPCSVRTGPPAAFVARPDALLLQVRELTSCCRRWHRAF